MIKFYNRSMPVSDNLDWKEIKILLISGGITLDHLVLQKNESFDAEIKVLLSDKKGTE